MREICLRILIIALVFMMPGAAAAVSTAEDKPFDEEACFEKLDPDERSYLLGLQYLMNCFQLKQYLTLSTRDERDAWIETFWLYLDPTPTTPENERRTEHEMRVTEARRLFGMNREPGWDRRGEIHIRFGEPDTRTIIDPDVNRYGTLPPREEWYYETFDMLVSFADITHNGEYHFDEEIPYSINSMLREAQQDAPQVKRGKAIVWLFFIQEPFMMFPEIQPDLEKPNEALTEKIEFCHESDIDKDRLLAYIDITSFRGGAGAIMTEINFELPSNEFESGDRNDSSMSEIELRVLVRNACMDSVSFASDCITTSTPEFRHRPYSDLVPGQVRVTLPPGYYRFGMEVVDVNKSRRASYRRSLRISPLDDRLAISDVKFAGRIRETEENGKFVKGTLEVVPHPTHIYKRPRPVIFYFEVYGLDMDEDGLAFYSVEYRVTPCENRRWGPVLIDTDFEISSSFETTGFGSTQPMRLTIDTGEMWEGAYELLVKVRDRRTLMTATTGGRFYIIE